MRVGADTGGFIQHLEVGIEIQSSLGIKRANLRGVSRVHQLYAVIHAGIPGRIALGAEFEIRAKRKREWKIHHGSPEELVRLLIGEIRGSRLGRKGSKPTWRVAERSNQ